MFSAFARFIFFLGISILSFLSIHVVNGHTKEYLMAILVGALAGFVLFIFSLILFPIKKKEKRPNSQFSFNRNNLDIKGGLNKSRQANQEIRNSRPRNFEDTDRIEKINLDSEELNKGSLSNSVGEEL